jgi:murein DD-endopeptidase MepM/ murein hydrolase activator NlpD
MGGLDRPRRAWQAAAAAALLSAACASTPEEGATHVVRPGENLYRISKHYGVSVEEIREANRIEDVTELRIGQRLAIPGSGHVQPAAPLAPPAGYRLPAGGGRELARREANLALRWPLEGRVSSPFGWRSGRRHEGIDIPAKLGTTVRAAEAGRVIHSGKLAAYGNVVIIKHSGRYSTVYAHNDRNRVEKGQFVERGDPIATVGRTGNASGSHLHFEVRRDRIAHDPLDFLPAAARTASR